MEHEIKAEVLMELNPETIKLIESIGYKSNYSSGTEIIHLPYYFEKKSDGMYVAHDSNSKHPCVMDMVKHVQLRECEYGEPTELVRHVKRLTEFIKNTEDYPDMRQTLIDESNDLIQKHTKP